MKMSVTMRNIARDKALQQGPKVIEFNDKQKIAYALNKTDLRVLFETAGFNTDGIAWLKQICRWRIIGELVPLDKTVLSKTENDWSVIFVSISEEDSWKRHGWAGTHDYADDMVIG